MKSVFDRVNSYVPQHLIQPTLDYALSRTLFGGIDYKIVGNTNKAVVGDIDIAVDKQELIELIELKHTLDYEFWPSLDLWLKRHSDFEFAINKGFKQFHLLVPLASQKPGEYIFKSECGIDENGNTIKSRHFGQVQLDIFVGNLNWMKDILSGAPSDSDFKAVYRNTLLAAHIKNLFAYEDNEINSYLSFDFRDGIKHKLENKKLKTKRENVIMTDANEMARHYYNVSSWEHINSFEKVLDFLKRNNWHNKKSEIIHSLELQFKKLKLEVPEIVYD